MEKIKVLDCTLRDGGYVNNWGFGIENIRTIINKLCESNMDIIECGFLTQKKDYEKDRTIFNDLEQISCILPKKRLNSKFVCMINYGEYNLGDIPNCDGKSVDGIRVAFHKKDKKDAMKFCKGISEKGYDVFIQPMVTISYTDEEIFELIHDVNIIEPEAVYIVDSFGVMKKKDLMRVFYLIDHNLKSGISIGYHSHNNLQLAYSNSQSLVDLNSKRTILIDSCVLGMGRGAGNLNTELFIEYLNDKYNYKYIAYPLLQIIDQVLNSIYKDNYWGYSLPHYISAVHNCHPSYASYLSDKNTLTVENLNDIISSLCKDKKLNFDRNYIEKVYKEYQENNIDDSVYIQQLREKLTDKRIIILAPGSSLKYFEDEIQQQININDSVVISVNFIPDKYRCDYIFVSNLRRYDQIKHVDNDKLILTSNIEGEGRYKINYRNLLNEVDFVHDNSGLMLIKLLSNIGVRNVILAGFDGYSDKSPNDYFDTSMNISTASMVLEEINEGIGKVISDFMNELSISFITPIKYGNFITLL